MPVVLRLTPSSILGERAVQYRWSDNKSGRSHCTESHMKATHTRSAPQNHHPTRLPGVSVPKWETCCWYCSSRLSEEPNPVNGQRPLLDLWKPQAGPGQARWLPALASVVFPALEGCKFGWAFTHFGPGSVEPYTHRHIFSTIVLVS